MHRIATWLLLWSLVAVSSLLAAPVLLRKSGPWFDGWEKPTDPVGDCTFDRKGDRLTITVPGKKHGLHRNPRVPRLLRKVEGDFVVQVRVDGNFEQDAEGRPHGFRAAGLYLTDGHWFVTVTRREIHGGDVSRHGLRVSFQGEEGGETATLIRWQAPNRALRPGEGFSLQSHRMPTGSLRVRRRGNRLEVESSEDGKEWTWLKSDLEIRMPGTLKVGVLAGSTVDGVFKAVFDQFKLTKPAKEGDGKASPELRRAKP